MEPLAPPNREHLEAAQGWLELGDHVEANEELEKITAELQPAKPVQPRAEHKPLAGITHC